jgi:hypothetical protein
MPERPLPEDQKRAQNINQLHNIDTELHKAWVVWQNPDLNAQLQHCFPAENGRDKKFADAFTKSIIKNHEYFEINRSKRHGIPSKGEGYTWGREISEPGLTSPEQKSAYVEGVVRGLSWVRDIPIEAQRLALDRIADGCTPMVRVVPLWEDRNKSLAEQQRIMLNFTGLTSGYGLADNRGVINEYTLILKNQDDSEHCIAELNRLSEGNFNLLRVLPFSLRNAAYILNPKLGREFFDAPVDSWNWHGRNTGGAYKYPTKIMNFAHKFAAAIDPLPDPIKDETGEWHIDAKQFGGATDLSQQRWQEFVEYSRSRRGFYTEKEYGEESNLQQKVKRIISTR